MFVNIYTESPESIEVNRLLLVYINVCTELDNANLYSSQASHDLMMRHDLISGPILVNYINIPTKCTDISFEIHASYLIK